MARLLWRYGPAVIVMAMIFLASDTPGPDLPTFGIWDFVVKKGSHFCGYALLGLAYLHALVPKGPARGRAAVVAVALAALYAVTDEAHQVLTPGRGPSLRDVGIDTAGAAAGVLLRLGWQARPRRPR